MGLCLVLLAHLQLFSVLFQQLQEVWFNKSQDGTRYLYDYMYASIQVNGHLKQEYIVYL